MIKVLVTGGAGFVGSNVSVKLVELGYHVTVVDDLSFGNLCNLPLGKYKGALSFIKADIKDLHESFLSEFDVLVSCHCANIIYAQDKPLQTFNVNATDTMELFGRFDNKIVYTSTASVYGAAVQIPTLEDARKNLTNAYSSSKYIAEVYLRSRGNYTTLRLSNVYGVNQRPENPYCGVIGKFISQSLNGEPINVFGDGTQTRDFTYIDDTVRAIVIAVEKQALNTEINIASGKEVSVNELAQAVNEVTGNDSPISYKTPRSIDNITRRCLNVDKAKLLLGWEAKVGLNEGLNKTVDWVKGGLTGAPL